MRYAVGPPSAEAQTRSLRLRFARGGLAFGFGLLSSADLPLAAPTWGVDQIKINWRRGTGNDEGPSRCSGPVVWMTSGYGASGGGLTRNPEWPLQESPGWKPDALRSAGVAPKNSLLWPQFCGGAPPGPGKPAPSPSSRPEKAQIELAWAEPKPSPPTGWPLPLISPALAVLAAPPSRIAVANTVAAAVRNRMFPPEDDADGAETVLETGRSSASRAPRCKKILGTRSATERWAPAPRESKFRLCAFNTFVGS